MKSIEILRRAATAAAKSLFNRDSVQLNKSPQMVEVLEMRTMLTNEAVYWIPGASSTWDSGTLWYLGSANGPTTVSWGDGRDPNNADYYVPYFTSGGGSVSSPTEITLATQVTVPVINFLTTGYELVGSNGAYGVTLPSSGGTAFNVASGVEATIGASLTGGPLTVQGGGNLTLTGSNSYTTSTVTASTLQIGSNTATGTLGTGKVSLGSGSTLAFNMSSAASFSNNIALASGTETVNILGATTTLTGVLSGTGSVGVAVGGLHSNLALNGSGNLSGSLTVDYGNVNIGNSASFNTSSLSVDSGANFNESAGATISVSSLSDDGVAALTQVTPIVGRPGGIHLAGHGNLIVNDGTLNLAGTNTFTGTTTVTSAATVSLQNSTDAGTGAGNVTIDSGATLNGTGSTTGTVTVDNGGTLDPGVGNVNSILQTGSVNMSSGSNFNVALNGDTPGSTYDQLEVKTGTVTLAGILNLSGTRGAEGQQTFVIVKNDPGQPILGGFSNAPDGGTIFYNDIKYGVSYEGDGGHDIVLTDLTPAALVVTTLFDNDTAPSGTLTFRNAVSEAIDIVDSAEGGSAVITIDPSLAAGNAELVSDGASLALNPSSGAVEIQGISQHSLTIDPQLVVTGDVKFDSNVIAKSLEVDSGTISTATGGILTIGSSGLWTNGTISGTLDVAQGAVLNMSDYYYGAVVLSRLTLNNFGTLDWTDNNLQLNNGSTINNEADATFEIEGSSNEIYQGTNSTNAIDNYGNLIVDSGANSPSIFVPLNNNQSVDAVTGSLRLNDGGTSSGTFTAAANASLQFEAGTFVFNSALFSGLGLAYIDGGTIVVNGSSTVANLEVDDGTISTSIGGVLTIGSSGLWTNGTISGTLDVAQGAVLNMSDYYYGSVVLSGLTLNNFGTLKWTDNSLQLSNSSTINNEADATFEIEGSTNEVYQGYGSANAINNYGDLIVDSGASDPSIDVPLNNNQAVEAVTGSLRLENGGTSSGTFTAAAGSSLQFDAGTFVFNSALFSGLGLAVVNGGTVVFNGTSTVANLEVDGGTISAANAAILTIGSSGLWTGGTISGTLDVAPNAALDLSEGLENVTLSALTLNNSGTLNWNPNYILFSDGSTINNLTGGVCNVIGEAGCYSLFGDNSANVINNEGTMLVQGDAYGPAINIILNNSGLLEIQAGVLQLGLDASVINTGTIETNGGDIDDVGALDNEGTINLANGNLYYFSNDASGGRPYTNNGTIEVGGSGAFYPDDNNGVGEDFDDPGPRIAGSAAGLSSDEVGFDWEGFDSASTTITESENGGASQPYTTAPGYNNIITVGSLTQNQTRGFAITSRDTSPNSHGTGSLSFSSGAIKPSPSSHASHGTRVLLGFVDDYGNWVIRFDPGISVSAGSAEAAFVNLLASNPRLHNTLQQNHPLAGAPELHPDLTDGTALNVAEDGSTVYSDFSFDPGIDHNISYPGENLNDSFPTIDPGTAPTSKPYYNGIHPVFGDDGSPTTPQGGGDPVSYGSGTPELTETDLTAAGFSGDWSVTRDFTTQTEYTENSNFGNGWMDSSESYLQDLDGGAANPNILVVSSPYAQTQFDYSGTSYTPAATTINSLTYDSSNDLYTLLDASTGSRYTYFGFNENINNPLLVGQLDYYEDAGGNTTHLNYDSTTFQLDSVTQSDSAGDLGTFVYNYDSTGQVSSVIEELQPAGVTSSLVVRQAVYSYYDGSYSGDNAYGSQGDLKTVEIEDSSGNVLDESYYRYYTADTASGIIGGLQYAFSADNVAKLNAVYSDFESASDAAVSAYADEYFEYNSDGQVTTQIVGALGSTSALGLGTYTFSYRQNQNFPSDALDEEVFDLGSGATVAPQYYDPSADTFNTWYSCTTETTPNGNQNTVYTNIEGSELLEITTDNHDANTANIGHEWITAYQYDGFGLRTMTISPSAINTSFYNLQSPTFEDQLNLGIAPGEGVSNTVGLVTLRTYESAYGSAEYPAADYVEQGWNSSDAIEQDSFDYITDENADPMWFLHDSIVYRNGAADDTSYTYTWQSNSLQPVSIATSLPVTNEDESGTDISTTAYDSFGNPIWTRDQAGFIAYTGYNIATGAIVQTVADVKTAAMPALIDDVIPLPSGWATPAGGGLNLDTVYRVDDLGRTTWEISPAGNVTATVYDDVDHAVFTFPGVAETVDGSGNGTLTTTGPITMIRTQIPYLYLVGSTSFAGIYNEMLTFSGTVTVEANQIVLPGFMVGAGGTFESIQRIESHRQWIRFSSSI